MKLADELAAIDHVAVWQYELGTYWQEAGFPLDGTRREICTGTGMIRSGTTGIGGRRSSRAVRLVEWVQGAWRKIATGAAALLALSMAFHVIFGPNGLTVYQQKRQETQLLAKRLQNLQHENDLMKGHVERLQNDPNAIEHQAREELHYTRPGEVIYTLPPDPAAKDAASQGRAGSTMPTVN